MAEHRRSGRHTEPSEEDEINHMEETKYRRAPVSLRPPVQSATFQAYSEHDEIPNEMTQGAGRVRAIHHYHPETEISMDTKSSRSGPVYSIPSKVELGQHRQVASMSQYERPVVECSPSERHQRGVSMPELEAEPMTPAVIQGGYFDSPFWAPFGSIGVSVRDGTSGSGSDNEPRVQILSNFFHLECTNFVTMATSDTLSLSMLRKALEAMLSGTNIDILEFVACHSVYECSYHQGNRFISLNVRVFEPPPRSFGQLLDTDTTIAEKIDGGLLVEVQLREGDRLHFSALFREMLLNFSKVQDEVITTGTLRYKPRPTPQKGEGLVLESINYPQPSRFSMKNLHESANELQGSSPSEPMDEDMIEDVVKLAEVLEADFLDVQADAATAVAGLTNDAEFREQLSDPKATKAADALCNASARLLAETDYRPARRQAAVTVANLSSSPALCRLLLKSDPPLTSRKRGIVDALVTLAMLRSNEDKEEEIGTRRECMRALLGLAEFQSTRPMPAMKSLLSSTPSGKGAECKKLGEKLQKCRDVLARRPTFD